MDAASVIQLRRVNDSRARVLEISAELRSAVALGDDAGIASLLGDLLRFKGTSRAQRVALQQRALQSLVYLLRSAAMNDEVTGLQNRRGFLQSATRLLDVAVRERAPQRLIYIRLSPHAGEAPAIPMMALRHMANTLRDLFPSYGVREALGRLGPGEFAALTPSVEYLSRDTVLRRIGPAPAGHAAARTRLDLGIAHFDPMRPVGVDALLAASVQQALGARVTRLELRHPRKAPQHGMTLR